MSCNRLERGAVSPVVSAVASPSARPTRNGRRATSAAIALTLAVAAGLCGCSAWWWPGYTGAVPDRYPLGTVNRAHYHTMETNAAAADFILYRNEFENNSTELSPYGKDHILEIAARARCAPFPVLVERSENNSDPQLDQRRQALVARILFDCGVSDANQRTVISPAYGQALTGSEAEADAAGWATLGR
jgi:hypothetical protein